MKDFELLPLQNVFLNMCFIQTRSYCIFYFSSVVFYLIPCELVDVMTTSIICSWSSISFSFSFAYRQTCHQVLGLTCFLATTVCVGSHETNAPTHVLGLALLFSNCNFTVLTSRPVSV